MSQTTILMIEDSPEILRTNRGALKLAGYRVLEAETLAAGRQLAESETPDLILLDILLPDGNGLEYCRELFGQGGPRILFLSCLDEKQEVIEGLRAGGDDYMTKPYLMDELLARVEVLLRRPAFGGEQPPLRVGTLELEYHNGPSRAKLAGEELRLAPKELALLEALMRNKGRFVTSQDLYRQAWKTDAADTHTVKQHIYTIREKLGRETPVEIEAEQGRGYRLREKRC